jgi:hypothetical protein
MSSKISDNIAEVPDQVTGGWLNSLPPERRIKFLQDGFGHRMNMWAAGHVSCIWFMERMLFGRSRVRNGSIFFLGLGDRLFAVTAAHVFDGYLAAKRKAPSTICRIGNLEFDPERRLVGRRPSIDIATFDFSYDELRAVQKQALLVDPNDWPPPHPFSGQGAIVSGFPGSLRLWTNWNAVNFGLYSGHLRINNASDRSITCPFEREYWIDTMGHGLPAEGLDLGGISGGPLLMPMETGGSWSLQLAGVVSEAPSGSFETVVSVPAHFIASDGTIYDERSAPVRHAVPAVAPLIDA